MPRVHSCYSLSTLVLDGLIKAFTQLGARLVRIGRDPDRIATTKVLICLRCAPHAGLFGFCNDLLL